MITMRHFGQAEPQAAFEPSIAPEDRPLVSGFLTAGDKITDAEQRVWAAYRKLVIISQIAGGLPTTAIAVYRAARQAVLDAAMPLVNLRNKQPGVTPETPILPPDLDLPAPVVQGLAGARRRGGLGAIVPARDILVTFAGKQIPLADPLAGSLGIPVVVPGYGVRSGNLGAPPVIFWVILGVGFSFVIVLLIVHEMKREGVERIRIIGEQSKLQADNLDKAMTVLDAVVTKCVEKGGDPVKCLEKGEEAVAGSLKALPKPPRLPEEGFTFFEVLGISALVAGVVIGGIAIWRRREQITTIISPPAAPSRAVSGMTFKRIRSYR